MVNETSSNVVFFASLYRKRIFSAFNSFLNANESKWGSPVFPFVVVMSSPFGVGIVLKSELTRSSADRPCWIVENAVTMRLIDGIILKPANVKSPSVERMATAGRSWPSTITITRAIAPTIRVSDMMRGKILVTADFVLTSISFVRVLRWLSRKKFWTLKTFISFRPFRLSNKFLVESFSYFSCCPPQPINSVRTVR